MRPSVSPGVSHLSVNTYWTLVKTRSGVEFLNRDFRKCVGQEIKIAVIVVVIIRNQNMNDVFLTIDMAAA